MKKKKLNVNNFIKEKIMELITALSELTPVEEYDGILYKRDDLYLPYEDYNELGGGKVRQMQLLYESMKSKNEKITGLITNPVSLSSPQSAIVAKIAKDNNVPCMICIGGKIDSVEETAKRYKPLSLAYQLGAEIKVVAKIGYRNVVTSRVNDIIKENNYEVVNFGINLSDYPDAIIGSTANQVLNLPDYLDNLIIPCGSAITMAGIIVGIEQFKKQVKRIIGTQISGYDRRKYVDSILNKFRINRQYEFIIDTTYPYAKNVKHFINPEFELNVKYESKAVQFFLRNKQQLGIADSDKTLIWIIGNNNFLFD
ncbi:MAG: pyridoxal-phosphate dependent enzyme [Bacteroidetes bacterium]|nr:MAG: pyridoxal-phosphate dependent enzyme [Bacteroidota bacterium]